MLVLTRRAGEEIILSIGDEIIATIMVVEVRRGPYHDDRVRIGINAPLKVQVNRREVHERIHAAKDDFALCPTCGSPDCYPGPCRFRVA